MLDPQSATHLSFRYCCEVRDLIFTVWSVEIFQELPVIDKELGIFQQCNIPILELLQRDRCRRDFDETWLPRWRSFVLLRYCGVSAFDFI